MKKITIIQALVFFIVSSVIGFGQAEPVGTRSIESNEYYQTNHAAYPCISPQEYREIERQCAENIRTLGLDKNVVIGTVQAASLNWPIRAAAGFTDCDYYFIGAYVDQDTASGSIKDYDCETNTYDGHHGTDISVWPFGFYKMDNSQVEVIAAAPGTIIQRADGNFDRNCTKNTMTANSIIIQHADGTYALYWHMKKNSVTPKTVGQTVAAGEYLGVAGSSGSASGPHLHFEVWAGSTNTTYNDPFAGTCNARNTASWWNVQRPHTNPAVIKVSVNTTDIVLPGCPTTETPNEADTFNIPFQGPGLGPGYAKFYVYIRDDVSGMTADCKILNPNGTTFNSWANTSTANNKVYIRGYSKLLPTIPGTYTFQATYNGITCQKKFTVQASLSVNDITSPSIMTLYPNPSTGTVFLKIEHSSLRATKPRFIVINSIGQTIQNLNVASDTKQVELNLLPGMYFFKLVNDNGAIVKSGKFLIE